MRARSHDDAFQLLVATILSAQTTDENVNKVTPALFAEVPESGGPRAREPGRRRTARVPTGFYRSKTKNLLGMARMLEEEFDGEVPTELDDLVKLPGVGRKTGNVVRSVAFDLPGLPGRHPRRPAARRLKLTTEDDPVKVELDLNVLVPPDERGRFSLRLILHGRQVCFARKPACGRCVLVDICPSADPARQGARRKAATRIDPARRPSVDPAQRSSVTRPAPSSARSAWSSSAEIAESSVSR